MASDSDESGGLSEGAQRLSDGIVDLLEQRCASSATAMLILTLVKYRYAARRRERVDAVLAEYDEADAGVREAFELGAAAGFDASKLSGGGDA